MTHNDYPFKVGDKATVIRTERGWLDGSMTVMVVSCHQKENGVWQYEVKEIIDGTVPKGSKPFSINHTRDLRKI